MAKNVEAQRAAERRYYHKHKEQLRIKKALKKARVKSLVQEAKSVPCTDCGIQYPYYVMDFDHVRGTKVADINLLVGRGNLTPVLEEIKKCEVVCANCHRERTHQRLRDVV